jgi:uncharacterized protein YeaC (DUF1315 family)
MDYQQLIETMSLETYKSLQQAVELGKWPDGKTMTREQRENTLQAVIAWGRLHLDENQRVGYIDKKHKEGDVCEEPTETTLTWKD